MPKEVKKSPKPKAISKITKEELKTAETVAAVEAFANLEALVETEAIVETIIEAEAEVAAEEPKAKAKAGKRSAKALAEKEVLVAKEERKISTKEQQEAPALHVKPARSRLERSGKKLREASTKVEKGKEYSAKDALALAVDTSTTKFDGTLELHVNLNIDPRQADQNVRENLVLPAGTGKTVRVAVFADGDELAAAKTAGADIYGNEEFLQLLDKEKIEFDLLISTPLLMAKLGKYARLLGPKGLMPNPKSGTVTTNIKKAVEEAKAGRVEYRVDSTGIIHVAFGKVSFGTDKLMKNLEVLLASIKANKPASVKGNYVKSIHISTTMGPSVKVAVSEI